MNNKRQSYLSTSTIAEYRWEEEKKHKGKEGKDKEKEIEGK